MLNLFTFRISGFSVSTCACGRDRHHDTGGRRMVVFPFTVVMHLFLKPLRLRARVSLGAFGAHTPCRRRSHVPPARCEHGALLEGVPLRNTRFAEADLRGVSTGREVAHRLAYPPRGHGVTAVPRPAPLTKQRPRTLVKTWPRVGWNRDRNVMGPPMAFADRDDFKHPEQRPDLDSSGGATGYVGRRRKTPAWKA